MGLFRRKQVVHVCTECRVHFEPPTFDQCPNVRSDLCATHRKPHVDKHWRKKAVQEWAEANWEKLEPRAKKDLAKEAAQRKKAGGSAGTSYYSSPIGLAGSGQLQNTAAYFQYVYTGNNSRGVI